MDPSQRNKSSRCDYHMDHGHEIDQCRSLKFIIEKLIRVGHLRRYLREVVKGVESGQLIGRIVSRQATLSEPRPAINYILGGPTDD